MAESMHLLNIDQVQLMQAYAAQAAAAAGGGAEAGAGRRGRGRLAARPRCHRRGPRAAGVDRDRKSTRLNSSHR